MSQSFENKPITPGDKPPDIYGPQGKLKTSQLASPRPGPREYRAATMLAPLAAAGALLVAVISLACILRYPRVLTVYGSVQSFDGEIVSIETLTGSVESFAIDADTTLPSTLSSGDVIVVHYRDHGDAKVATEIAEHMGSDGAEPGADVVR